MSLRRYSRFIFNAYKKSRIRVPKNPVQEPISKAAVSCKPSTTSHPIFRLQKRYYFKIREYERWFHNPKRVGTVIVLFSCGVAIGVASGDWVTVPYSGRTHFILFHKFMRKMLPDKHTWFIGETVVPLHPAFTIMTQTMNRDTIDEAPPIEMEIKRELETAGFEESSEKQGEEKKAAVIIVNSEIKRELQMQDGESSEKHGEEKMAEVTVVDSGEVIAATSGRFGKIFVTTEFLYNYGHHVAMVATIFGNQVGHDLARHHEEKISKSISLVSVIGMNVYLFWQSAYIRSKKPSLDKLLQRRFLPSLSFVASVALLSYFPMMKYLRDIELEADYIGLMLAASAGYDPTEGLQYPVQGGPSSQARRILPEWFYPHPSRERRTQHLNQPKIVDEACSKFRQHYKTTEE